MKVTLPTLRCQRCGHAWVPRRTTVTICPECKNPKWATPLTPTDRLNRLRRQAKGRTR